MVMFLIPLLLLVWFYILYIYSCLHFLFRVAVGNYTDKQKKESKTNLQRLAHKWPENCVSNGCGSQTPIYVLLYT